MTSGRIGNAFFYRVLVIHIVMPVERVKIHITVNVSGYTRQHGCRESTLEKKTRTQKEKSRSACAWDTVYR
jgi:hypothetical protein